MRVVRLLVTLSALVAPLCLAATPATSAAQQPAPSRACTTSIDLIRVSEIKPGMMAKFLEAVAAQKAWYKNAGAPDEIGLRRLFDPATGGFSETQAITSHASPANGKQYPRDAAFGAFVEMFKASSTIKTEYVTCVAGPTP